jgi:hypothetical protein
MSFDRSSLRVEEYRALRATVRERGTTRLIVSAITFVSWATLAVVVYAVSAIPLIAVFPLFVLVAGFESSSPRMSAWNVSAATFRSITKRRQESFPGGSRSS